MAPRRRAGAARAASRRSSGAGRARRPTVAPRRPAARPRRLVGVAALPAQQARILLARHRLADRELRQMPRTARDLVHRPAPLTLDPTPQEPSARAGGARPDPALAAARPHGSGRKRKWPGRSSRRAKLPGAPSGAPRRSGQTTSPVDHVPTPRPNCRKSSKRHANAVRPCHRAGGIASPTAAGDRSCRRREQLLANRAAPCMNHPSPLGVDVLVVGGGLTGLALAAAVAAVGAALALVERHPLDALIEPVARRPRHGDRAWRAQAARADRRVGRPRGRGRPDPRHRGR